MSSISSNVLPLTPRMQRPPSHQHQMQRHCQRLVPRIHHHIETHLPLENHQQGAREKNSHLTDFRRPQSHNHRMSRNSRLLQRHHQSQKQVANFQSFRQSSVLILSFILFLTLFQAQEAKDGSPSHEYKDLIHLINCQREKLTAQQAELTKVSPNS